MVGTGKNEGVEFRILSGGFRSGLSFVVSCLAKLSVKEGGGEAAGRLHCYLVAATDRCVPAQEITVFHGLVVGRRVDLERGAYLAPYELAKREFDLPDEREPFPKKSYPIAAGVPLLSRTRYVRLEKWIDEINPNFAFGIRDSGGFTSDVWPDGRELSDADVFLGLSQGWYTYPGKSDAMTLAVRRLAASLSRPGGRFGREDRILDTAIALEVFYGGTTGRKLSRRAAALLGAGPEEQTDIYDQARRFYNLWSDIVHSKVTLAPGEFDAELEGYAISPATLSLPC